METSRKGRRGWSVYGVLVALAFSLVATIVGVVVLWPSGQRPQAPYLADGTRVDTVRVNEILPPCQGPPTGEDPVKRRCNGVLVDIDAEPVVIPLSKVNIQALQVGDKIDIVIPPTQPGGPQGKVGQYIGTNRTLSVGLLVGAFVVLLVAVARLKGFMSMVGLGFGSAVLVVFTIPALLTGGPGLPVALVSSAAIMFVVLFTTHGFTLRTASALLGTFVSLVVSAFLGAAATNWTRLSGVSDDEAMTLAMMNPQLDFHALMTAAIVIAGLGILNDVTITQASAVWELNDTAPHLPRSQLFSRGMRIGRDHIASTVYTIIFAYAGSALPVLLLVFMYKVPVERMLSSEQFGQEIVRSIATAMGLILAVPITTAIAALTVPKDIEAYPDHAVD